MKVVHKYSLQPRSGRQSLLLPKGAEILAVGVQDDYNLQLWTLVDVMYAPEWVERTLLVYATGEYQQEPVGKHLGTLLLQNGAYVLHVFEVPNVG